MYFLIVQKQEYCQSYHRHNTKWSIAFVSPTYEGSISDRKLVEVSGLLDKLEDGDELIADKGFQIQDLLTPLGVHLNIPPFLDSKAQMPVNDVLLTRTS